jgi:hypothetical protein
MLHASSRMSSWAASCRKFSGAAPHVGDPFVWDHHSHWNDMFRLDSLLSEEERMIRYEVYLAGGFTNSLSQRCCEELRAIGAAARSDSCISRRDIRSGSVQEDG